MIRIFAQVVMSLVAGLCTRKGDWRRPGAHDAIKGIPDGIDMIADGGIGTSASSCVNLLLTICLIPVSGALCIAALTAMQRAVAGG